MQDELVDLARRARDTDIRRLEDEDLDSTSLLEVVVPQIRDALHDTMDLLGQLSNLFEPDEEPSGPDDSGAFYRLVDDLVEVEAANEQLADLAFMGAVELRGTLEPFEKIEERVETLKAEADEITCRGELLSLCFRGRRKIIKITTAMENTLAHETGIEARLDFVTELQSALKIRYAYAKMRHAVLGSSEPKDSETLRARLVTACTAIANLRGRDAYWCMRYHDRIQLRHLQERLVEWSRPSREVEPEEGLHLWQDIVAFTRLLDEVNRRAELQEHDRKVVEKVRGWLESSSSSPDRIPEDFHPDLISLYGCDEEIELLLEERCFRTKAWRRPLDRLRSKFNQVNFDHDGRSAPYEELEEIYRNSLSPPQFTKETLNHEC